MPSVLHHAIYCILYCFAMCTTDQIRNHFGSSKMLPRFNSKGGGKGQTLWEVGQMEVPLQVPKGAKTRH